MPDHFDAIIIGAGQAGGPLSTALGKAGIRTAIIEEVHVGGTCVNEGCTPTKTMVASARIAYLTRRAADYGVHFGGKVHVDMKKVRQRKRDIVESFRNGSESGIIGSENVELFKGHASFSGPGKVIVRLNNGEIRELTAERFFINTGAHPSFPPIKGLEQVPVLNSTSIMELEEVPRHLLVLGGGYIGLEFGQMFRRFGSQVTVIHRGSQLLEREDLDVATEVAEILKQDGINIHLKTITSEARYTSEGAIELEVKDGEGKQFRLEGTHLLIATGRTPNTDSLNLSTVGVKTDKRGFIEVNERLETSVPDIYAMGDVKGGPAFTHISYDDFRIIRTNLLENGSATTNDRLVPYTVFIDPQLGRIGISETEAREQGRNFKVAKLPMSNVARAIEIDETRGFMKAVVDLDSKQILGCTILGVEGGEVMAVLEVAMMGHLPYTTLKEGVFAHPTLAESLNNLFMTLD